MTEHIQPTTRPQTKEVSRPNWSAVFSVAFCVACLITVEFLPVSLLTPMAQDLGISEGVAGQSVTVTAFVAMFASLFITQVIGAIAPEIKTCGKVAQFIIKSVTNLTFRQLFLHRRLRQPDDPLLMPVDHRVR